MALPRSPTPSRLPGGATTDQPYGPLADSGYGNPFFYHQFADDFDNALGATGLYTITAAGGSIAHAPGDGGIALFTTGATASQFAQLQLPNPSFTLPQGAGAGKKLFYLTRIQISDVVNSVVIAGLCASSANVFSTNTDALFFYKQSGGTNLFLISAVGGASTTIGLPAGTYNLVNNTNIDLAFYVDGYGNVNVFSSPNMVGYVPQSGTGTATTARGRIASMIAPNLTTANLTPTLAVQTSTAAAVTMRADFHATQKER